GIGEKIKSIIQAIQRPFNKAIDFVIKKGLKLAGPVIRGLKGLGGKAKAGANKLKNKALAKIRGGDDSPAGKQKRLDSGLAAGQSAVDRLPGESIKAALGRPVLAAIRVRYGMTRLELVARGTHWVVEGEINPKGSKPTTKAVAVVSSKYVVPGTKQLRPYVLADGVREWFYKKNFRLTHKTTVLNEAAKGASAGWVWCAGHGSRAAHQIRRNQVTIDHRDTPVARHWNSKGRKTDQATRYAWYDDPKNLVVLCGPCNSSKGSGGVTYTDTVEPGFKGYRE
ncbi:hypothetical protein, partial [Aeromicrobium sp.]|uniref:hypothetical protein n=1 Tax=Aeromicrobium sp. TaxID=1871063 RepID=UPI002FCBCA88